MMYSNDEKTLVGKQFKKYLLLSIAIVVAFAILAFAFMARLAQWKGALFLSVGVCIGIFILTIYAFPIRAYYRFISDILRGQSREIRVPIIKVSDQPVYKDNKLLFYEISTLEEDVERMLLFDANKGKPDLNVGDEVVFRIYENYIIEIVDKNQSAS